MSHALERAQNAQSLKDIADLDKARLLALADFLKKELETKEVADVLSSGAFLSCKSADFSYTLDVNLGLILQELPPFKRWLKSHRLSFKDKCTRLEEALEAYVNKVNDSLFPENPPKEEFTILHSLLAELLQQTESALLI